MASIGSSLAIQASLSTLSTTSRITNLSIPLANTEVSLALSTNMKAITIACRGNCNLQFAFTATESGTKYITIPKGAAYAEDGLNLSGVALYIQADQAAQVVEIIEWF